MTASTSRDGGSISPPTAGSIQHEDAFGNVSHVFTAEGPLGELSVQVEGEVETRDTQGIVRGAVERFPPSLYLRETPLTAADEAIAAFAASAREKPPATMCSACCTSSSIGCTSR